MIKSRNLKKDCVRFMTFFLLILAVYHVNRRPKGTEIISGCSVR